MLSEVMTKKLTHHFHFSDRDGDGYVEWQDWQASAMQLAAVRNWPEGSAEYQAILERHREMWRRFWQPADTDGDGRVSLEEYLQLATSQRQQSFKEEMKLISTLFGAIFDIIDLDHDGKISIVEYRLYFQAWGLDEALAEQAFDELDFNDDGLLSRAIFIQFGSNFFMSDDEDVIGNKLFGPLD